MSNVMLCHVMLTIMWSDVMSSHDMAYIKLCHDICYVSCHVSCYVRLCYAMSCNICYVMSSHMSCHVIMHHVMLCHAILCYVIYHLSYVISYICHVKLYTMSDYAICHVMLYCVMWCHMKVGIGACPKIIIEYKHINVMLGSKRWGGGQISPNPGGTHGCPILITMQIPSYVAMHAYHWRSLFKYCHPSQPPFVSIDCHRPRCLHNDRQS